MATRKIFELFNNYDIVQARQFARELAREMGFGLTDQTRIATAISEVAQQTLSFQGWGRVQFVTVLQDSRRGFECACWDCAWMEGNVPPAQGDLMQGVKRLVDEFELDSRNGDGLAIVMRKWLRA